MMGRGAPRVLDVEDGDPRVHFEAPQGRAATQRDDLQHRIEVEQ